MIEWPFETEIMPSTRAQRLLGDRVQNARPGEPVELWIYSAFAKDNWVARRLGDLTHADHPGTAIQIGNDLFEILKAEETTEGGYAVRYGLKRWDPQLAVRILLHYTADTQSRSAADYLEEEHKQRLRARILRLFLLAGLAPDPLQREWEEKTALNMKWISAASAVATVLICMVLIQVFGQSFAYTSFFYIILYFLGIESALRPLWIVFSGKPHGTLLLTLPYVLWEGVARPEKRRRKKEYELRFTYDQDEVIRRPATGHLVIRSMLFDDMLAGPTPILFEGAVYRPLHWHQEGKGLSRRLVYELEKVDTDPKGKYREYTQARAPERQKVVEAFTRNRERVQVFALLWGTYPRDEQLRLKAKYHFRAPESTAITAGLFLAAALLQISATILFHPTVLTIAGPVYWVFESLYRLYQSKVHGLPAASFAGYLLGLFLRPPP